MHPRTKRQREVYDFITSYIEKHGHEPSYQVVAKHLGVASKAGIGKHIKALEAQGLLQRQRVNGSFRLAVPTSVSAAPVSDEAVEWLEARTNGRVKEYWEGEPFVVPEFILGSYDASDLLAFRVPDDAMAAKNILEGDIVLIEKRSHARDGDLLAVTVKNSETMLRQFYRRGANVELRTGCDEIEPTCCSGDEIQIHGVFRGLIRPAN